MQPFSLPAWEPLPEIALYMDQVVSILEKALDPLPDGEGKAVTPAMINNYVKQKALRAPEKKRYGRGHVSALFIICTLKRVLTMGEIKSLYGLLLDGRSEEQCYALFRTELHCALDRVFGGGEPPAPCDQRAVLALRACCGALAEKLRAQELLSQIDLEN